MISRVARACPGSRIVRTMLMFLAAAFCLFAACSYWSEETNEEHPVVELNTTMGVITIELYAMKAPVSVTNFVRYVKSGFYDSTIIHRVIPDFIIQGGQYTVSLEKKEAGDSILCELYNGLSNLRGTVAVARGVDPNSGTCQFFINLKDNPELDRQSDTHPGYAVFGRVKEGMDVVDAMAAVPTSTQQAKDGTLLTDVPVTPIVILSARKIE